MERSSGKQFEKCMVNQKVIAKLCLVLQLFSSSRVNVGEYSLITINKKNVCLVQSLHGHNKKIYIVSMWKNCFFFHSKVGHRMEKETIRVKMWMEKRECVKKWGRERKMTVQRPKRTINAKWVPEAEVCGSNPLVGTPPFFPSNWP